MSKRCPVCGKFANEECVSKFESERLEAGRLVEEVRRLEKELESKNIQLSYWYGRLTELEERGFWARVFNRKKI